jgi:Restriction endonuclease NotI
MKWSFHLQRLRSMASTITEFFGYAPNDNSTVAVKARKQCLCPFIGETCTKVLRDGEPSGVCTLSQVNSGPVICCPVRLYADHYKILRDISDKVFGDGRELVAGNRIKDHFSVEHSKSCVAVFGKRWGRELRLPNRKKGGGGGAYFVDWILAEISPEGQLISFVAVEVQSIDTTGNYRNERKELLKGSVPTERSTAGLNWENVSKRILPQIIFKGHVLRQEPLCQKGLFFVCPKPVYQKIIERLGGKLNPIHMQPGSLTIRWYDIGEPVKDGNVRSLVFGGERTSTIDQVALAFTAPSNLPEPRVYEAAIAAELA